MFTNNLNYKLPSAALSQNGNWHYSKLKQQLSKKTVVTKCFIKEREIEGKRDTDLYKTMNTKSANHNTYKLQDQEKAIENKCILKCEKDKQCATVYPH